MNDLTPPISPDISPTLLRSFLAVAKTKSFTEAARKLGLRQSTVSQHVQKLEQSVGGRLFLRDTHAVTLTADGDAMCDLAQTVLEANDRMARYFFGSARREKLRLGISEDFAMSQLAEVLTTFRVAHPMVDLELTVGLSSALYQSYDAGEVDVIFAKRRSGDSRGEVAWREQLAWIARPGFRVDPDAPVPLVAYAPPSITRSMAVSALEEARRPWRMACSSGSLNGLRAATMAGLGVAAHSARLIPEGLVRLDDASNLPELGEVEFVAIGPGRHHTTANALIAALVSTTQLPSAQPAKAQ
ncbi:LysR family transcriptional regulator [Devosia geojensis]|uniref:LysR family transcriptional regulator n=1 Tax=Devosia geojensis TaxID=443610 RepID=A0A0F5FR68_9HYPH|nr:LysR substrate-binding domain-containing protein [Devosia geojensis]KKB11384.1 LysR family transcriptional regulator [Devosia geojensis]